MVHLRAAAHRNN